MPSPWHMAEDTVRTRRRQWVAQARQACMHVGFFLVLPTTARFWKTSGGLFCDPSDRDGFGAGFRQCLLRSPTTICRLAGTSVFPQKRTFVGALSMSAKCQKQTSRDDDDGAA
jgi:hypothetical protein